MTPEILSAELRRGTSKLLKRRRVMLVSTLLAAGSMAFIALYQIGILEHLPEPPLSVFDADQVDASPEAYTYLRMPDGILGLGNYSATLALIAMGGERREQRMPWLPLALAAKLTLDCAASGKLTLDQFTKHHALCFWCLLATAATFANVPLLVPEVRAALRQIRG